ncbi:MAG: hypothetical protein JWO38_3962 [Gemmataceae bacterium]|nr:hypothetical protein [Gemmataceae bacterium]
MRRSPAGVVAVGVLVGLAAWPSATRAGVWVTLAAGLPGGSTPTSDSEFWFDSPHAPPLVALDKLAGGTTAQATTGGGKVFFGGDGTPVLLNLADGSAYVASGTPPAAATSRGPNGGGAGTPASAAPVAGGTAPSTAALLGVTLAQPDAAGARGLTASVTDPTGTVLGTGHVTIPADGWWVLGLTPGTKTTPNTGGTGGGGGTGGTPDAEDIENPDPPPGGRPVVAPEPATLVLVGFGGVAASAWRRARRVKLL